MENNIVFTDLERKYGKMLEVRCCVSKYIPFSKRCDDEVIAAEKLPPFYFPFVRDRKVRMISSRQKHTVFVKAQTFRFKASGRTSKSEILAIIYLNKLVEFLVAVLAKMLQCSL